MLAAAKAVKTSDFMNISPGVSRGSRGNATGRLPAPGATGGTLEPTIVKNALPRAMRRVIGRLAIACILGAAPAGVLGDGLPPGFVRLAEVVPEIRQEMRYAGTDNFLGRPVEGYEAAECWLLSQAAEGLARAARSAS